MNVVQITVLAAFLVSTSVQFSKADQLRVGVEKIQFHPHYWQNKKGQYSGYARELFDLFAEKSGHTIEYIPLPPSQMLGQLFEGKIDFKYPDHPAWGEDIRQGKNISYTEEIARIADGSFVEKRLYNKGVGSIHSVGVVKGFSPWIYQEFIDSGQIEIKEFDSLKELIRANLLNKIDAAFYNVVAATYFMENLTTFPLITFFDDTLPFVVSDFKMSTVSKPEIITQFNEFLKTESEAISRLKDSYDLEKNLDNEFLGLEQYKINFIEKTNKN